MSSLATNSCMELVNKKIEENGNEEVVQGILKMMEKMTEQIFQMEMDSKHQKNETVENEANE